MARRTACSRKRLPGCKRTPSERGGAWGGFAQWQIAALEECLTTAAAQDQRLPFLVRTTGISLPIAQTLLAAIGDTPRFPAANHLVGYAGPGAAVHDSGQSHRDGRITKAGRRGIRAARLRLPVRRSR